MSLTIEPPVKYCPSIYKTVRWKTREVKVGRVGVGGDNPVRIQSMTTTPTCRVEETIEQIVRLVDQGCEMVRVTVQGAKEAKCCEVIKNALIRKGMEIPLIADVHFYPPAAMSVAEFVDKVRINPGNFVDPRATFTSLEYDEASYLAEIQKIEEKFAPLVEKCAKLNRTIRIGTNHGSLSDRIMNRYGDTSLGMVESALEFARICRKMDYHAIIFSMKASNPLVMVEAYRLLVAEMMRCGWDYPMHLGVTEAGEGREGRVKSAVGIGSLLLDGLGDTIRVSLTEDPWQEMNPCIRLISLAQARYGQGIEPFVEQKRAIKQISPRPVDLVPPLHRDGSVILTVMESDLTSPTFYEDIGLEVHLGRPQRTQQTVDGLIYPHEELPEGLKRAEAAGIPIYHHLPTIESVEEMESLVENPPPFILFKPKRSFLHEGRRLFDWLRLNQLHIPVLLHFAYEETLVEDVVIAAAAECGALLVDKLGEGVALTGNYPLNFLRELSFLLLQACRMRRTRAEFISCPGCGRTLFDLQEVSKRIRERTAHLQGVTIAIMGCIVNGPGEMADADFGYVGSGRGKIDLYVGKTRVERGIASDEADEKLIELIKAHGCWVNPIAKTPLSVS